MSCPGLFGLPTTEILFEYLTVNDGLSENAMATIMQDRSGFIWIGTHDGLNKYDGYDVIVYRNVPDDKNSLSDNTIGALCEDALGKIWIDTKGSRLNRLDPFAEACTRYVQPVRVSHS
jgi:ligand-binding sensor domain-containing protein